MSYASMPVKRYCLCIDEQRAQQEFSEECCKRHDCVRPMVSSHFAADKGQAVALVCSRLSVSDRPVRMAGHCQRALLSGTGGTPRHRLRFTSGPVSLLVGLYASTKSLHAPAPDDCIGDATCDGHSSTISSNELSVLYCSCCPTSTVK